MARQISNFKLLLITMVAVILICRSAIAQDKELSLQQKRQQAIMQRSLPSDIYGRKDPFAPITGREGRRSMRDGIELEGIMWDASQPLAVINGVILHEGETIRGKKILRIERDRVILGEDGDQFILRLGEMLKTEKGK